ncbi:MAG: SMC family ATPase, partial [Streptosporangiaceae bacterium]
MRLHNLKITAFGPFSGTEEVDFSALSDAGLFLINGQTGAGKTSVLDAICFALYGQIPGVRNAVKTLRSDHAAAGVGPGIVLETTIRGRSLRITRSPAWERPKLRGAGTRLEQSHVLVEEFTGGRWQGVATRLDEAGDFLGRLLGMNAAQFCQVAMLPQGEFAAFLRAGAEDRRRVLEKLFATEIYAAVEKWLAERRAATRREAEELAAAAGSTADRIAETTGSERPDDDFVTWATELGGQLAAILEVNEGLLAGAQPDLDAARTALAAARELLDRQDRHAKALLRHEALESAGPQRDLLAARLDAAARADRVVPLIRAASDRGATAERDLTHAAAARRRIAALAPQDAPADVLLKAERSRRDETAGLEQRLGEAQRHQAVLAELTAGRATEQRLAAEEAAQARTLAEMPGLVAQVRTQLETARIRAGGLPAARKAVADTTALIGSARRRDLVTGALTKAEDAHRVAIDTAQQTRTRLLDLRQARLEGMAAALAVDLVAGQPCKVCGSAEHPEPAAAFGLVVSDADQNRAEDAD